MVPTQGWRLLAVDRHLQSPAGCWEGTGEDLLRCVPPPPGRPGLSPPRLKCFAQSQVHPQVVCPQVKRESTVPALLCVRALPALPSSPGTHRGGSDAHLSPGAWVRSCGSPRHLFSQGKGKRASPKNPRGRGERRPTFTNVPASFSWVLKGCQKPCLEPHMNHGPSLTGVSSLKVQLRM